MKIIDIYRINDSNCLGQELGKTNDQILINEGDWLLAQCLLEAGGEWFPMNRIKLINMNDKDTRSGEIQESGQTISTIFFS